MIDFEKMIELKNALENNKNIQKLYADINIDKNYLDFKLTNLKLVQRDYIEIFNAFLLNLNFLKEYVKSDKSEDSALVH